MKVSITGHKKQLQKTIDTLYELNLLDIENYQGELDTGEPFKEAEELSEMLVDVRSLLSKIHADEKAEAEEFNLEGFEERLEQLKKNVKNKESEISGLEREIANLEDHKDFFEQLEGIDLNYEELDSTNTLKTFIGDLDSEKFEEAVETDHYDIFDASDAYIILYSSKKKEKIQKALREAESSPLRRPEGDFTGTPDEILEGLHARISDLGEEKEEYTKSYEENAVEWRAELEAAEEYLSEKVEKAEAPLNFATTDKSFIVEGWIPEETFNELGERLHVSTEGSVHLQEEEPEETPPTKLENNRIVQPFESLTNLVDTPGHRELDPSFMLLLTFPIMFGFMIGDAGYGLTSFLVFYAGYKKLPKAAPVFKSLMYASVATIFFGLIFGDAFGYVLFGSHSDLAAVTGIQLFESIPLLFHRAEHLGQVFNMAAIIGFAHVNLGFLLGFYNDFVQHGLKDAFLEDISWIVMEIGAIAWYLYGSGVGAPILLISVVMLYVGEGVEGVVEIPSLLSNILSYLRIFGVAVAAVSLAKVVNALAAPLFSMGTTIGLIAGIAVLMFGHTFNTFIKIMEGFLQGIRLHYVELFTKFFEGGGRRYMPFGSK